MTILVTEDAKRNICGKEKCEKKREGDYDYKKKLKASGVSEIL
jgi:hypothetical protein